MKNMIEYIVEAQKFIVKGHTKHQSKSLMYYAQQFLNKKIVEPEKHIEPLRIFGDDTYIHIGIDKISDNNKYLDEKDCEKLINAALKNDAVHLNFKIKNTDKFIQISKILKTVFNNVDTISFTNEIYIEFTSLDKLKQDLDEFLEKI